MSKRVLFSEREFEAAFHGNRRKPSFFRPARAEDPIGAAAHFLAGALMKRRYRLFRNGGTPLLERREGSLTEEIVVQSPPERRANDEAFLTISVHLSHAGLRDVRARYWTTPARAPTVLASGNAGELDIPPGWAIWDVSDGGPVLERLVEWVDDLVVPWFELFEDPAETRRLLFEHDIPLLPRMHALEWMIAEYGPKEARDYYRHLMSLGLLDRDTRFIDRLQAMSHCFRLS